MLEVRTHENRNGLKDRVKGYLIITLLMVPMYVLARFMEPLTAVSVWVFVVLVQLVILGVIAYGKTPCDLCGEHVKEMSLLDEEFREGNVAWVFSTIPGLRTRYPMFGPGSRR